MLTVKALAELTELQEEYGWTNEKKYIFAAQEIMTFERNETLAFKKFCKNKATANGLSILDDEQHDYASVNYWDKRYSVVNMTYDWLVSFESLKVICHAHLKPSHKILIPGCGNAKFSFDMYDHGYVNTISIDNSEVVINQMKERQGSGRPHMKFEVMNACQSAYDRGQFDIVFDKSLFDCLLCGIQKVDQYLTEMNRVTKIGGKLIVLSLHAPEAFLKFVNLQLWENVDVTKIPNPSFPSEPNEAENYWIMILNKIDEVRSQKKGCQVPENVDVYEDAADLTNNDITLATCDKLVESSEEEEFEPTDRTTITKTHGFLGSANRDLYESFDWIDLNEMLVKAYNGSQTRQSTLLVPKTHLCGSIITGLSSALKRAKSATDQVLN